MFNLVRNNENNVFYKSSYEKHLKKQPKQTLRSHETLNAIKNICLTLPFFYVEPNSFALGFTAGLLKPKEINYINNKVYQTFTSRHILERVAIVAAFVFITTYYPPFLGLVSFCAAARGGERFSANLSDKNVSALKNACFTFPFLYFQPNLFGVGFTIGFIKHRDVNDINKKVEIIFKIQRTLAERIKFFATSLILIAYVYPTSWSILCLYSSARMGALFYSKQKEAYYNYLRSHSSSSLSLDITR